MTESCQHLRFRFTPAEIRRVWHDPLAWHGFVREREFEMIVSALGRTRFTRALELGAGDGGQSLTIARYCDALVCTELSEMGNEHHVGPFRARELPNVEYRLCDAQDLSQFGDGSFDLIFSSNLLEHVPDPIRCLRECARVSAPGGLIVHSIPTPAWKLASYGLTWIRKRKRPRVHGVSRSNWEELWALRAHEWRRKFQEAGLRLVMQLHLPFYVGHGNRFRRVVEVGNSLGLPGTYGYVLQWR